jgi:uncharacterized delta-60 repeat protein
MKTGTNKNRLTERDSTMNKAINVISMLVLTLFSFSQLRAQVTEEWVQRYNGPGNSSDNASSMAVDGSGNVYVTGSSKSGPGSDYATIKYNSDGAELWVARYNRQGDSTDLANSIAVDGSGNVYVTGYSFGSGTNNDYATIKYNSSGAEEWIAIYNSPGNYADAAYSIAVDGSGNVYVTGYSGLGSGGTSSANYTTIKYNSAGAEQWVALYDAPGVGMDWARAIAVDGSGNVYVTGASDGTLTTVRDYATIKYNSAGAQQWVKRYNGPGNDLDFAWSIAVDGSGNVYVTGFSKGSGTSTDYATIKYSSAGTQLWVKRYNGPGNSGDDAHSIAVDGSGNVYVTGISGGIGTNGDYATIKYNSSGVQQWVARYNGPGNSGDWASSLALDGLGNVYVTGWSIVSGINYDYATVKYSASGGQQWVIRYNGPGNESDNAQSIALDDSGNVYVTGGSMSGSTSDYATIKYLQLGTVYQPDALEKWIAGETNTIKWTNEGWLSANIKCILNFETPQQTEYTIARGFLITNPEYVWEIPDTILSYQSKIFVENAADTTQAMESGVFRLKPYVLTKLYSDSTYYAYDKARDQWGFSNNQADMWPASWYSQFNYQGIDPFTGISYDQFVGDSTFAKSISRYHPDWVSWVNTFTVGACYYDTTYGIYKPTAVLKWWAKSRNWGGSCFGIAASNALAFGFGQDFRLKYPTFPAFGNPISVVSGNEVKKVVNELFTNQYGNPSIANDQVKYEIITPTQTLNEIKQMLKEDNAIVKTLSIYNNGPGSGAHTILVYGLKQDSIQQNLYYVHVYDNSNPYSSNPIVIDTTVDGGNGWWSSDDWTDWGGNRNIYLEVPANNYLFGGFFPVASVHKSPSIPNKNTSEIDNSSKSPFILSANTLEIHNSPEASISIIDYQGKVTGFNNNIVLNEIPESFPRILKNGSESPPYAYELINDEYSVIMNNFTADTIEAFFFTSNKSFSYERSGALQTQTDRLFFGGGVSVTNPDAQTKSVKLLNIINETTEERVFILRSIDLAQNDSVNIKNPNNDNLKFISYGSAKNYDIELNFAAKTGLGRFVDFNIPLSENTSHTFVPNWTDITNNELMVLVDVGNNGTIDDTLYLQNQVTGIGDDQGSLLSPDSYNLAQNYPNPFNPVTAIRYQLPVNSHVILKVFDVLGREVATLVNDNKKPGSYDVEFDATKLPSGVYFYRLEAVATTDHNKSFTQVKKMLLLR